MRLLRACWSDDPISFDGNFHHVHDAVMQPKPQQGRSLPLLVGGHSDAALRRAATLGDGWLASQLSPEEVAAGRARLDVLTEDEGRDRPLEVYARATAGMAVDAALIDSYRAVGIDELLVDVHTTARDPEDCMERLQEVGT
jgi:alkanesulfonate monooxygenase SsuD/methylene tetrahydromethanopterin reductase-like flavin-dependent oxidoreductase (luciferase family)